MEYHNTMYNLAKVIKSETNQDSGSTCPFAENTQDILNWIMSNQPVKSRLWTILQPKKSRFLNKYTEGKEKKME